ncbi:MAG: translation initiation factor IF-2 N-terminal domain-containing protein, partial [Acidobacteriota bacterium]|nr:translation initiation factor IF-2 N-terminal domain-containing protein [Acidobacteriota bacterium]MDQ3920121.1 translation initiation factor IF-2 N-terminal domain-containing protein [Acidobacteriota bacterium]
MSVHTSKVRLYDLAKELKQDTKRIIEEVRREGVDVSVPSNSISKELADKIRNRYFPKKEQAVPRKVVVVKKARPTLAETAPAVEESPSAEAEPVEQPEVTEQPQPPAPAEMQPAGKPAVVRQIIKKLPPAVRAERPTAAAAPAQQPAQEETEQAAPAASHPETAKQPSPAPEVSASAPAEQVTEPVQAPKAVPPSMPEPPPT